MKNCLIIFYGFIFCFVISATSYALIITESYTADGVDGMSGLIFEAYNDVPPPWGTINYGVYSFVIGAAEPAGTAWAGGNAGWDDEDVSIVEHTSYDFWGNPYTVYRVYEGEYDPDFEDDMTLLFELTDDSWAGYTHGYFYYTYDQHLWEPYGPREIGYGNTLTVYALTDVPGSPFAFTTYLVDPDSAPPAGYTPTGYGMTQSGSPASVPEPATLFLLGTGIAGLFTRLKRRKNKC